MQENIKFSKIDKERNKPFKKKNTFLLKKTATILYLLDKCLKMKVHKMLEC